MASKLASNSASAAAADIASARRVLGMEADGLNALSASLGDAFAQAIELLDKTKGHVIISGMGKSGHIARKIAATMASTGQPAFFVHPGEASHGDLGMIQDGNVVIAMSNSGETAELSDIIAYTRRFNIPLISMTGRADSTLSNAADVALVIPPSPEACPIQMAPTTSTTVMLALGDAIAVALMERRSFTAEDFRNFHPGGKLGNRLLKIEALMHGADQLPLVDLDSPMSEALLQMTAKSFGAVGVVDGAGNLKGVVTDGDLRRHMSGDLMSRTAGQVMTEGGLVMAQTHLASEALRIMNEKKITSLFIVGEDESRRPVGILHVHDCLRAGVA